MMDRLWSTPPHTLGAFSPACWPTSTNCTGGTGAFDVAASTNAGSFHRHRGVASASINVPLSMNKEEPRKRRRGQFIRCDYKDANPSASVQCIQLFHCALSVRVLRLCAHQFLQHLSRLLLIVLHHEETCEIEIRLIESRIALDTPPELRLCFRIILLPYIQHAQVVQRFRIVRPQVGCLL